MYNLFRGCYNIDCYKLAKTLLNEDWMVWYHVNQACQKKSKWAY